MFFIGCVMGLFWSPYAMSFSSPSLIPQMWQVSGLMYNTQLLGILFSLILYTSFFHLLVVTSTEFQPSNALWKLPVAHSSWELSQIHHVIFSKSALFWPFFVLSLIFFPLLLSTFLKSIFFCCCKPVAQLLLFTPDFLFWFQQEFLLLMFSWWHSSWLHPSINFYKFLRFIFYFLPVSFLGGSVLSVWHILKWSSMSDSLDICNED